jgi:hypothetical protein
LTIGLESVEFVSKIVIVSLLCMVFRKSVETLLKYRGNSVILGRTYRVRKFSTVSAIECKFSFIELKVIIIFE